MNYSYEEKNFTNKTIGTKKVKQPERISKHFFNNLREHTLRTLLTLLFKPKPLRHVPSWHTGYIDSSLSVYRHFINSLWEGIHKKKSQLIKLRWYFDKKILGHLASETINSLIKSGYYEPNEMLFLRQYLKKGMVFIDVGAHIGLYTIFAAPLIGKQGKIFSFEPSNREFKILKKNTKRMKGVTALRLALSDSNKDKTLHIADDYHSGHNTIEQFTYPETKTVSSEEVPAITLDEFSSGHNLTRLDVLKIDVEGHESSVIDGGLKTIKKFRPLIIIEVSDYTPLQQLEKLGYSFNVFSLATAELISLTRFNISGGNLNVIAFPNQSAQKVSYNFKNIQLDMANQHKKQRVSIVTPCYNDARFIAECIESVLSQEYLYLEHIIQDGGSTDDTIEIVTRYAKKYSDKIKFVSETDSGQADGLNKAIQRSTGDIFLVLNADDALLPHASSWAVKHLSKNPDAAVVYGDGCIIDENSKVIERFVAQPYNFEKLLCVELVLPAQASFIKKVYFEQVGFYADSTLDTCPDYEMWESIYVITD